jgi:hypothetical protein
MYSPGFVTGVEYDNQLRTEYLVQCNPDELAFFNITAIDMQGAEDCQDNNGFFRCQDYVQIIRGSFGTTDTCGNTTNDDAVIELEFGDYVVVFRTSEEVRGRGFQMYSLCFRPTERDLPDCFEVSEFTTGVCSAGSGSASNGMDAAPPSQTKRAAEDELNGEEEEVATSYYADLFTGYPANLKMAKDLAKFHHQWNRRRREADKRHVKVNVLYNQTVNYSDYTIFIFGPDNEQISQFKDVRVLQTFDANGTTDYHVGKVKEDRNPHFFGAGPLTILGTHAYFQLFVIDPRGLLPDEEEQVELVSMTAPLLDSVPPEDDMVIIDEIQEPADLRRFPGIVDRRQANEPLTEMDREAVFTALRNAEACNPVLRAQSRATLEFYNSIDTDFVDGLRTFNISCSLNGDALSCTSDGGVTLPGRTMCVVDSEPSFQCEPFSGEFTLIVSPTTSVTVTARNCLGQTAQAVLFLT